MSLTDHKSSRLYTGGNVACHTVGLIASNIFNHHLLHYSWCACFDLSDVASYKTCKVCNSENND